MNRTAETIHCDVRTLKGAVPEGGGPVPLLLRLVAPERPHEEARAPIDLALVLDRSGSMTGAPFEAAKRAAHDAADLLEDEDRLAIVAFGSEVEVVVPLAEVARRDELHARIDGLRIEGMTALHAGWVEGAQQLVEGLDPARTARVVLLTDGNANVGTTDAPSIGADVGAMYEHGVATSAIGLGSHFDEDLLQAIADAGGGRFAYAEDASRLEGVMASELIGLDATVARRIRVGFEPHEGRLALTEVLNDLQRDGDALVAPDLVAGVPVQLVALADARPLPAQDAALLGTVALAWTDAEGCRRTERHELHAPVLDDRRYAAAGEDPDVAAALASLRAVRLRREAMDLIDRGDHSAARTRIEEVERLLRGAPATDAVKRELASLPRLHEALERQDYQVARKHMAMQRERARKGFDEEAFMHSAAFAERRSRVDERRAARERHEAATPAPPTPTRRPRSTDSGDAGDGVEVGRPDGTIGRLRLSVGDLTDQSVDAIVNPTNPRLFGTGATVDGAVHRRGGMELTRACRAIGRVEVGDAVVTKGYDLPAPYVLHTAVPVFEGRRKDEALLASCYRSAFRLAREMRLTTLAFPAIGAGSNGFPPGEAARIALEEILTSLGRPGAPDAVEVVLYDRRTYGTYAKLLANLTAGRRFGAGAA